MIFMLYDIRYCNTFTVKAEYMKAMTSLRNLSDERSKINTIHFEQLYKWLKPKVCVIHQTSLYK